MTAALRWAEDPDPAKQLVAIPEDRVRALRSRTSGIEAWLFPGGFHFAMHRRT